MKSLLKNVYYFFPVQLFILHFKKYQVLLLFWWILFSATQGSFLKTFGASGLILSPEYLGKVNFIGSLIVGLALGVFIMSWNITTFILHSRRFNFLATTTQPFLKYCINNSIIPILFLTVYCIRIYRFNDYVELKPAEDIWYMIFSVWLGILFIWFLSFAYFFSAERTIVRSIAPLVANPQQFRKTFQQATRPTAKFREIRVNYFLTPSFRLRKPRSVAHYRQEFIDVVFKRHHLAGMVCIFLAFVSLVVVGFLLENRYFEMPAAASFLILFAVLIAVMGALAYFLGSWSLLFTIILVIGINALYKNEIIDPRNKAYGLHYDKPELRPAYNKSSLQQLCTPEKIAQDKQQMIEVLEKWKKRQKEDKPLMVFVNVSGGGLRSAAFVMSSLQQLDSLTDGDLMKQTFMMTGASGGMLAATYYRELYRQKVLGRNINLHAPKFGEQISGDLLNPVFTSMIARDLFAPVQKFEVDGQSYIKDRGYAFEKKLSDNTRNMLNFQIKDRVKEETEAMIPMMMFNSVIKSDGRKMMICSQPISFMMKPRLYEKDSLSSPDAVDFNAFFKDLEPRNLRALTALRMNATFPYVLPNVWLPTNPVIDVMDAGLRDNYGTETSLRFIEYFQEWINENTGGVVMLMIRDKQTDNWQNPFITNSLSDMLINPFTVLQHNWYKLQDYFQNDQVSYFTGMLDVPLTRISMVYVPEKEEKIAAMNFHLSARERRDVEQSFYHPANKASVSKLIELLK